MKYSKESLCVKESGLKKQIDKTGSVSFPIYQTATFSHIGLGQSTGYDYSRLQNPTREELERIVCSLEYGVGALAFSSGMAAISTIFEMFSYNDEIIAGDDLYGGSIRVFDNILNKHGIKVHYVDTSISTNIIPLINEHTKALFIETPTNPMMIVSDIKELSIITKAHNILLIVDNTFLTPYFQNPLLLGADIVIHSGTKYLSGHNDAISGFLVVNNSEIETKLRYITKSLGNNLSPFDSWLLIRGIKTLAIRMEKSVENAIKIVDYLKTNKHVKKIYYCGLPDSPGYLVNKKQSSSSGSMISFELDSYETVKKLLENLNLIQFAESLGGVESLITYPKTQTHADVDPKILEKRGINERLVRLSVGIESAFDLINDLDNALLK
jgi:cystathionine gamma-synthase